MSGLTWDPLAAAAVAEAGVPVVLMHHQGDPQTMQDAPRYGDVLVEALAPAPVRAPPREASPPVVPVIR